MTRKSLPNLWRLGDLTRPGVGPTLPLPRQRAKRRGKARRQVKRDEHPLIDELFGQTKFERTLKEQQQEIEDLKKEIADLKDAINSKTALTITEVSWPYFTTHAVRPRCSCKMRFYHEFSALVERKEKTQKAFGD